MIKTAKVIILLINIIIFIFIFSLARCILWRRRPYYLSRLSRIFSKIVVRLMGVKITIYGNRKFSSQKGVFFVTNHVSYLDGVIISSIFPLVFVARGDLKNWPFFGIFASISDTIFVNRSDPSNLRREIQKISSFLSAGTNIILFPEGTTTNGNSVTPFKSSFFEAAFNSHSFIVPFTIKYNKINNSPVDAKNKDLIFWYGDMHFTSHLVAVLGLRSIEAQLEVLEPINTSQARDRKQLSILSQRAIEANLARQP